MVDTMSHTPAESASNPAERPLAFLTRSGCINTGVMRQRLDESLRSLRLREKYAVVDADSLPENDSRRGYGTPTILFKGKDLFGLSEPQPPLPSPT